MDGINFVSHLMNYIGETVTIFTTSGGESGSGFTGVVLSVNNCYVRLITQIGIAPGCALGNCCSENGQMMGQGTDCGVGANQFDAEFVKQCLGGTQDTGRFTCEGNTLGSVTDIPVDKIAAFVHNAV